MTSKSMAFIVNSYFVNVLTYFVNVNSTANVRRAGEQSAVLHRAKEAEGCPEQHRKAE